MIALVSGFAAFMAPMVAHGEPPAAAAASAANALRSSSSSQMALGSRRRDVMVGAGASLLAAIATAPPASASYALYQASYDTYSERKATNYVPVATNDRESLQEIQQGIAQRKGVAYTKKAATRKKQYCAGQTASVSPFLENRCDEIGMTKADQSNTMVDEFGNMNVGVRYDPSRKS
jgi:hypothetical protein